jgi:D-alanyl-lipoteichoic acid acyltransferase DltB (MBOAT superfamily)
MLFSSPEFIYLFLPIVLLGFFWLARWSHRIAATWLMAASLFFYGWWNPAYLGLLLGSILFNYSMGLVLAREAIRPQAVRRRILLVLGVGANLALLGYFKYANFFLDSANAVIGTSWSAGQIILPLGISFFTFTQIAFLVDAWRGIAREFNFIHYGLFVTYFPHLIAGPVLHHKEMMPQFGRSETYRLNWENLAVGLTIFAIGLFKKVVLADGVAPFASPLFATAGQGASLTFLEAWGGVLAYTLQLYFDFSGYSDMAIGASRLFGVRLPLNFNSPYQALNIVDFWRRWHMTLSRFLRDYLYFSLGGNRHGKARRYLNLMLTMVLGGLWHGAGWTYVVWGALHGFYLVVNHSWERLKQRLGLPGGRAWTRSLAWATTFLSVAVAWVFFRAESLDAAFAILAGMAGGHGVAIPGDWLAGSHWRVGATLHALGIRVGGVGALVPDPWTWAWMGLLLLVVTRMPNTQRVMADFRPALDFVAEATQVVRWRFRFSAYWAVLTITLLVAALTHGEVVSEFLYFQF